MVNPANLGADFSEGPAPLSLSELGGNAVEAAGEAPAPGPLDSIGQAEETALPPAPADLHEELGDQAVAPAPAPLEEDAEGVAVFGLAAPPAPSDAVAGLVAEQASDASSAPVPRDDMGDVIASGSGNSIGSAPAPAPAPLEADEGMTMSDASSGSQGAPAPMPMEALGRLDRGRT